MAVLTDISLWELIRHLKRWLTNLRRAGEARRSQSIDALRAVIVADHDREAALSETWTELGFRLQDLGLRQLAKRCDIKGRYWADPEQFDPDFLNKADVGLSRMEQLARQMVAEIERQ